jgi:hypothetical protein
MPHLLGRRGRTPATLSPVRALLPVLAALGLGIGSPAAGWEASWPITSAEMLRMQGKAETPAPKPTGLDNVPSCLPDELKTTLAHIERKWGPVRILSAYRPNARVRGTGRPSLHASCRAVDFRPPSGTFGAVARWLRDSHRGGVGTYSGRRSHIHIDHRPCQPGRCVRWHN